MTILKDTLVGNNVRTLGSLKVGVSGSREEGDHRAINGDQMFKTLNYPYKRILYYEDGYEKATVPIIIDDVVKKTKTICIQVMCFKSNRNIPKYIQIYDPDNWLGSITANSQTRVLSIYISAFFRGAWGDFNELYVGEQSTGYDEITVIVSTGTNLGTGTEYVVQCDPTGNRSGVSAAIMYYLPLYKLGDTYKLLLGLYTTREEIIRLGYLKYLVGGGEY